MNDEMRYIMPFSGESAEELEYYIKEVQYRLSSYVDNSKYNMQSIQEGLLQKEYKNYRVAFIASSTTELVNLIVMYLSKDEIDNERIFTGNLLQDSNFVGDLNEIERINSLGEIAQLWCWGLKHDIKFGMRSFPYKQRIDLGGQYYRKERIPRSVCLLTGKDTKKEFTKEKIKYEQFTLSGKENFIQEHSLYGKYIIPAAMYIELLFKLFEKEDIIIQNMIWIKGIDTFPITLSLKVTELKDKSRVEFLDKNNTLYCVAETRFADNNQNYSLDIVDNQLFLSDVKMEKLEIYSTFSSMQINYGETFQKLQSYASNNEIAQGVLVNSKLYRTYDMSVIDAAFQTALLFDQKKDNEVKFPFIVEKIVARKPLEKAYHIIVTRDRNKLNIGIYGEDGECLFGLKGYIGGGGKKKDSLITFGYQIESFIQNEEGIYVIKFFEKEMKFYVEGIEVDKKEFLHRVSNGVRILVKICSPNYKESYLNLLDYFKIFLREHKKVEYLIDYELDHNLNIAVANAIYSFIKTAVTENGGGSVRIKRHLTNKDSQVSLKNISIKKGKIYIVTGGDGGIGKKIVDRIITMGGIPVVLSRSTKLEIKDNFISIPVDITDQIKLNNILRKYGVDKCHGIFHFAGSISDELIMRKESVMTNVILSKIDGLLNLIEICSGFDFVVLASSLVSIAGNIGQCDYAFANGFLNGFSQVESFRENYSIFCLLWPLWKNGGMKISPKEQEVMINLTGLEPISDKEGLDIIFNSKKILGCTGIISGHSKKAVDWINLKGKVNINEL